MDVWLNLLLGLFLLSTLFEPGSCVSTSYNPDAFFDTPPETLQEFLQRGASWKVVVSTAPVATPGEATADSDVTTINQGTNAISWRPTARPGTNIKIIGSPQSIHQGTFNLQEQVGSADFGGRSIPRATRPQLSKGLKVSSTGVNQATDQHASQAQGGGVGIGSGTTDAGSAVANQNPTRDVTQAQSSTVGTVMGSNDDPLFDTPLNSQSGVSRKIFVSTGQAASTDEATADSGVLQAEKISNVTSTNQGTNAISGSHAAGQGTNIIVSGSSQVKSQGASEGDEDFDSVDFGTRLIPIPRGTRRRSWIDSEASKIRASQALAQHKFQSQGGAVGIGGGTVDSGTVVSNQDSSLNTVRDGTRAQSSSVGTGTGSNVKVNGAVQSESNGTSADQMGFNSATDSQPGWTGSRGQQNLNRDNIQNGELVAGGQSGGKGGASGEATSDGGTASSVQKSVVETDAHGTSVHSSSVSSGSGKGIRISGGANSGGQQGNWNGVNQNQEQVYFYPYMNQNRNQYQFQNLLPQPNWRFTVPAFTQYSFG